MLLTSRMHINSRALAACLMFALSASVAVPNNLQASELTGWSIQQDSQVYGEQHLSVTPDAIRMRLPAMHVVLLMHGPSWRVALFNEKTKKFCDYTLAEWNQFCAGELKPGHSEAKYIWHELKSENVAGIRTRHFAAERFFEMPMMTRSSTTQLSKTMLPAQRVQPVQPLQKLTHSTAPNVVHKNSAVQNSTKPSNVYAVIALGDHPKSKPTIPGWRSQGIRREIWVTKDLEAPPQLMQALAYSSGVVAGFGVPLRIIEVENDGTRKVLLATTKATKTAFKASEMVAPKGYAPVKDFMAVVLDSTKDEALDNLLGKPGAASAGNISKDYRSDLLKESALKKSTGSAHK